MSRKTLNAANLAGLGAEHLAALLIEVSTGSADIKRRLRLELSHAIGPEELGRDVRKRLVALRKARTRVTWRRRRALTADLQTQADMITNRIAPDDGALAFDLLWEFMALAPAIFARVDDSRGEVAAVFDAARARFADIAPLADLSPEPLAQRVWDALHHDTNGALEGITGLLAAQLGAPGLARLRALVQDEIEDLSARQARRMRGILQDIAEAEGDTDAFIAQIPPVDRSRPSVAADIAARLTSVGRADEALSALRNARPGPTTMTPGRAAWDDALIGALIALGRQDEAQQHRWERFTATLDIAHLRAHLSALPDFDDIEAEDRARDHVLGFRDLTAAIEFFTGWPDAAGLARLVQSRADELNGDRYELLVPAAELLRDRHPLAATILWRAMIGFALTKARAGRYGHAADHLADCAAVDADISDYGALPSHEDYVAQLRQDFSRRRAFWDKLG